VLAQKENHFNAVQRGADAGIRALASTAANVALMPKSAPLSVFQASQYWLDQLFRFDDRFCVDGEEVAKAAIWQTRNWELKSGEAGLALAVFSAGRVLRTPVSWSAAGRGRF
jgi:hypothetical protein